MKKQKANRISPFIGQYLPSNEVLEEEPFMRRFFTFIFLVSLTVNCVVAQPSGTTLDSLINAGMTKHGLELYTDAILLYKKALAINPACSRAANELAYTFFTVKDYEKAIRYARQSIYSGDQKIPEAFIVWASALDESGKPKQALKIYDEGLKAFPAQALLLYNKGCTQYRLSRFDEAGISFSAAVISNPVHPGSHLMLGITEIANRHPMEAMLALNTFLVLEPSTDRSSVAWENLVSVQDGQRRGSNAIVPAPSGITNDSCLVNLAPQLLQTWTALLSSTPHDTSVLSQFAIRNRTFFSLLPRHTGCGEQPFDSLYLPFFHDLSATDNSDAFSYYISQGVHTQESRDWFASHPTEAARFSNWFEKQDYLK
jgi:tetratricopeptide (TPR) repeat protein